MPVEVKWPACKQQFSTHTLSTSSVNEVQRRDAQEQRVRSAEFAHDGRNARMANYWERFVYGFFQYAPSLVVCLSFLPAGLVFGYSLSAFVAERNVRERGAIVYGPMILGACWGLLVALAMYFVKYLNGRIVYWHMHLLLTAAVFHVLGSCFYFANGFDDVGAFLSYVAHSTTVVAGLSFLHTILGRHTRAIFLSGCVAVYLLGTATAVSLIDTSAQDQPSESVGANGYQSLDGLYVSFAGVYLALSATLLAIFVGLRVLAYLGTVDCENSLDNELRIANSNGSVFDDRQAVIKRIQFFYVTRNQQWNVSLLLLYTASIQYAMFVYFIFWFSLNAAMRLTQIGYVHLMFWMVFLGSVVATVALTFVSVKVNYVANQLCLILLTVLSMILAAHLKSNVTCWLILFCFGMSFGHLQTLLVEVSHYRYTELLIYASYALNLLSTCVIYYYFVANANNSYFYSTDASTLMAQGFVFIIIVSLLALVVGLKAPRTYRTALFDIQYGLLGIIFMKHQIEQLNVKWLNDGTIPTISNGQHVEAYSSC